jgi:plasmid stability protein
MPVTLSIKNAPDEIVARLRERAARNHRSLQGELLTIIEEAVTPRRQKSIEEIAANAARIGLTTPSESAEIIRADRDRDNHRLYDDRR